MNLLDSNAIKEIVDKTLQAIESSKNEIFEIVDNAQRAVDEVKEKIKEVQGQINVCIDEVDALQVKDKLARKHLVVVSKDFRTYTERDIQKAYENATETRVNYMMKQQEETNLREKRTGLEQQLRQAEKILKSAQKLINQVSVAMNYLAGGLDNIEQSTMSADSVYLGIQILEAQEDERRRISQDIHDGPAQSMANIVLKSEIVRQVLKSDLEDGLKEMDELKDSVRETLQDIRRIIYDLRPMSFDDLGLEPTLRRYAASYQESTLIKVILRISEKQVDVENIIELAVFRLAQEALNNIRKHSKATKAEIRLDFGTKYLGMKIKDNGKGFDVDAAFEAAKVSGHSFGLVGMKQRVLQLHGEFKCTSNPGEGTELHFKIPISREVMMDEFQSN